MPRGRILERSTADAWSSLFLDSRAALCGVGRSLSARPVGSIVRAVSSWAGPADYLGPVENMAH